jgi:hypothetical protein
MATSVSALNVTLSSPDDTYKFVFPVNITFVGNATESATPNSRVANISLFLSDRTNASATLVAVNWTAIPNASSNKTSFTILSANLSAGNYTWKFVAVNNESTPITNSSANRTFEIFVDVGYPGINASASINRTNLTLGNYNYLFNVSVADNTVLSNVTLMINGSRNATNVTNLINGTYGFNFTFGQPTINLTFFWAVEACDTSGNCNQSQNITLFLDFNNNYYPQVNQTAPVTGYNLTNGFSTIFNATVSEDTGLANVSLMINGSINSTNSTGLANGAYKFPFTFAINNLTYNWAVRVCDNGGLCNITANRTFSTYTDVSFPGVNLSSPTNETNYTSKFKTNFENMIFAAIVAEGTQLENLTLLLNGVRNSTLTNTTTLANGTYTINFSLGLSNSTYTWAIEACDRSGNCNQSANRTIHTFSDDPTAPALSANYTNSSVTLGESLNLYALFSEASLNASNSTCRITLNGIKFNETINATVANSTHAWCNYTYLITSDYYPNITAVINVSDAFNNSIEARFITDFNLRCNDSITGNFTLYDNLYCAANPGLNISASNIKVDLSTFHINGTAGYNGILFSKNASNVLLTGGTIRGFSRGIFINGTATANNISVTLITNNSVGIFATTNNNNVLNTNISYSTERGINLTNVTTTWNVTARNTFIDSNISFNGTITFATGGKIELINSFLTLNGTFINNTGNLTSLMIYRPIVTVNVSNTTFFEDADANVTLYLRNTVTSTLIVTQETPGSAPTGYTPLKGVDIVIGDDQTRANLTWAYVTLFYNSSELEALNMDETSLKIYFYNTTSSAWEIEGNQFVDTTRDYVQANVTHFSLFGVFGTAITTATTGGAGSGGGGSGDDTCSEDWVCGSWSECSNGAMKRTCSEVSGCGTSNNKPVTTKACTAEKQAVQQPIQTTPPAQPKATEKKAQPQPTAGKAISTGGAGTGVVFYAGAAIVALIIIGLAIYFIRKR